MRYRKIAMALGILAAVVSTQASAADWTATLGGSDTKNSIVPGEVRYLATGGEASSVLNLARCGKVTIIVFGTSGDVMPQACDDGSCTTPEDLIPIALTGDTTNRFTNIVVPFHRFRVNASTSVNVQLYCGF